MDLMIYKILRRKQYLRDVILKATKETTIELAVVKNARLELEILEIALNQLYFNIKSRRLG